MFDSRDLVNPIGDFWYDGAEIPIPAAGSSWVIKPSSTAITSSITFEISDAQPTPAQTVLTPATIVGLAAAGGTLVVSQLGTASDGSAPLQTKWFRSSDGGITFPDDVGNGTLSYPVTGADAGQEGPLHGVLPGRGDRFC